MADMNPSDLVLIIDDDPLQNEMLRTLLQRKLSLSADYAECGRDALRCLQEDTRQKIKLVILDLGLPDMHGLEVLNQIQARYKQNLPVIILTGSSDINDAIKALKHGAYDYITKPYNSERIITTARNALKTSLLSREVQRLHQGNQTGFGFDHMIGAQSGLKDAVTTGRKAAAVDLPVLITGETGTGKDVFARAIHGESARRDRPFIAINCGAIPAQLVESTLFGHEKGAFTGATQSTLGKFREADGGTIFLDEIGELPLEAQVKLLRTIQQQEVEPVGAGKSFPIDVRILSATNRNLNESVENSTFREDLFYRLNVMSVELPPLRDRAQDIADFCDYFMNLFCDRNGLTRPHLSDAAHAMLAAHSWPGNVRELENTLSRAIALSDFQELTPDQFSLSHTTPETPTLPCTQAPRPAQASYLQADGCVKTLEAIEQEAMQLALTLCEGNTTKAAQMLGMAKSTFYRKTKNIADH